MTLRSLCDFAVKRRWLRTNPAANVKLASIKSDGFHTWTEDEIAQFETQHPNGSKPRLALALLLFTAQRRGDVVKMGRQHIRNGEIAVKQEKTGKPLAIPVHPHLQAVLDATPGEHLTFLVTTTGKPYGPNRAEALLGAWAAQGGLPPTCGSRMQRQRDREHQRTCKPRRSGPLHQSGGSGAARPQCDDTHECSQ
jgi:integrase